MKQADHVCSRMFRGMTKQEVTSLGDCSALVHYKDNPSWQYVPSLRALVALALCSNPGSGIQCWAWTLL